MVADGGSGSDPAVYVRVQNKLPNDSRWRQRVTVKPDTIYRLAAKVRAAGVEPGKTGANLSVLGLMETSISLYDTSGAWETVELYGKTGPSQETADILLRLGGYGSENVGIADFAEVSMTETAEAPAGASVLSLDPSTAAPPAASGTDAASQGAQRLISMLTVLGAAVFLYLLSIGYRALFSPRETGSWMGWLRRGESRNGQ